MKFIGMLRAAGIIDPVTGKVTRSMGILIKLNQNGFLTTGINDPGQGYLGTLEVIRLAKKYGFEIVVSHRSKEAGASEHEISIAQVMAAVGDLLKSGNYAQATRAIKEWEEARIDALEGKIIDGETDELKKLFGGITDVIDKDFDEENTKAVSVRMPASEIDAFSPVVEDDKTMGFNNAVAEIEINKKTGEARDVVKLTGSKVNINDVLPQIDESAHNVTVEAGKFNITVGGEYLTDEDGDAIEFAKGDLFRVTKEGISVQREAVFMSAGKAESVRTIAFPIGSATTTDYVIHKIGIDRVDIAVDHEKDKSRDEKATYATVEMVNKNLAEFKKVNYIIPQRIVGTDGVKGIKRSINKAFGKSTEMLNAVAYDDLLGLDNARTQSLITATENAVVLVAKTAHEEAIKKAENDAEFNEFLKSVTFQVVDNETVENIAKTDAFPLYLAGLALFQGVITPEDVMNRSAIAEDMKVVIKALTGKEVSDESLYYLMSFSRLRSAAMENRDIAYEIGPMIGNSIDWLKNIVHEVLISIPMDKIDLYQKIRNLEKVLFAL